MPTVRYTVMDGEIVSENRNGTVRDYVPDPLGSTIALLDQNQNITDTFSYWPYGEERTRTGTTPTPFRFVGTLGYYRDSSGRTYVRAREYQQTYGRWMTVDPLWPDEPAHIYAHDSPAGVVDESGTAPKCHCQLGFVCPLPGSCFLCLVCVYGQPGRQKFEAVKCWRAGSGQPGKGPQESREGRIPPGCWCFNDNPETGWIDMSWSHPAWGQGEVCMRLRPCDEAQMKRDYPNRTFPPGAFCLHGGADYNRYRTSGCITLADSDIWDLRKHLKNRCNNLRTKCFVLQSL